MRIAIIGAGVAGLTAAEALRRRGYTQVVLYEANERVGGKVKTLMVDDRPYELGAYITLESDDEVLALIERHGVAVRSALPRMVHDLDEGGALIEFEDWQAKRFNKLQTAAAAAKYLLLCARHREVFCPGGFADVDEELFVSADRFFEEEDLEAVAWLYQPIMAGLGYGFYSETPALYAMRFIDPAKLAVLVRTLLDKDSKVDMVTAGFQTLWAAVAEDHDVRLKHRVTAVRRKQDDAGNWTATITANGCEETYDRVITTVSHPKMVHVLDATIDEHAVFSRLRFNAYLTTVFRAEGLAEGVTAYLGQHSTPDTRGRLMIYSQPHTDRDLYLGWQLGAEEDAGALAQMLREDVAKAGGRVTEIVHQEFWPDYFPQVNEKALRDGHFKHLEALQGQRGTYYAGAMVDYELTGTAAAWAQAMVERYFPELC
jgi:hypothetical protein